MHLERLYTLYRLTSSTWQPSNHVGVECVVYSGGSLGGDAAEAASKAWAERLRAHLDVSEVQIKVDHVGTMLQPGDRVRINDLEAEGLSEFNGLVGTVMESHEDITTARVSVHGKDGDWDLPVDSLTLQPLFVNTPQDAPAICFCITNEWASSPEFAASVVHLLAMRSGAEDLLADDGMTLTSEAAEANAEVLSGLAAGAVFILCGDSVESQAGFQSTKETLSVGGGQILRADEAGVATDDGEHVTEALNDLEQFLTTHRKSDEHMQKQELREPIDNRATTQNMLNVHQAVTHISTLVRIVAMQLQQCFTFIAWDWQWPELLIWLRRWVGSWVLLDFRTLTNADCLVGGGKAATLLLGFSLPFMLLLLLCCGCCVSSYKRRKWRKSDNEMAAATSAHAANFGWALFTLGSPVAVSSIVQLLRMGVPEKPGTQVPRSIVLGLCSPFVLVIPLLALHQLRKAKAAGTLHARAFEARYGWLCSRYRADSICFAWELIMLEVRFLTIAIGEIAEDPVTAASLVITITLGLLIMQAKLAPFRESAEEAAHWSSCNKMGTVGYTSQLVVLAVGLLCAILGDSVSKTVGVLLSLVAVVALVVPLALTVKIIVMNKATIASVATSVVANVLHNTGASSGSDLSNGDSSDAATKQEMRAATDAGE